MAKTVVTMVIFLPYETQELYSNTINRMEKERMKVRETEKGLRTTTCETCDMCGRTRFIIFNAYKIYFFPH